MKGIIYKITNTVNEKVYVGITIKPLALRWKAHRRQGKNYDGTIPGCGALYTAMREFGVDCFAIEQIEQCSDEETLRIRERYWIHKIRCMVPYGYNVSVRLLTDAQVAIVKFNVHGLSIKEYAQLFGINPSIIKDIVEGITPQRGPAYAHDPYEYITRDHIPLDLQWDFQSC